MAWIALFVVCFLGSIYLWLRAHWFGALLMIPMVWWLIWLVALPAEPSNFQWLISFMVAVIAAGAPIWVRDNNVPRYEVLPPNRY